MFPWTAHHLQRIFKVRFIFTEVEKFFTHSLTELVKQRRNKPLVRQKLRTRKFRKFSFAETIKFSVIKTAFQTDKPDFLQLLLNTTNSDYLQEEIGDEMISHNVGGKREPLTDKQIISQSFLFLLAGFETTSITLTFVTYLLALNLDEQEKCYEEIKSITGNEVRHDCTA